MYGVRKSSSIIKSQDSNHCIRSRPVSGEYCMHKKDKQPYFILQMLLAKREILQGVPMLSYADMLKLKRWNTPTIYNGWEAITQGERLSLKCNRDETRDFMPQMGPMIGYAVTVTCQPGNKVHYKRGAKNRVAYQKYLASLPGPTS